MTCNCEVAIGVAGLPRVTCQIDLTRDLWTLEKRKRTLHNVSRNVLTLSSAFSFVRWSLNIDLISARVAF